MLARGVNKKSSAKSKKGVTGSKCRIFFAAFTVRPPISFQNTREGETPPLSKKIPVV
jgi:hypothetical protein